MNLLAPPYPVPDSLQCWQRHNNPGSWAIAFITPEWRCSVITLPGVTAETWQELCEYVINKAKKKGYDL